MSAFLLLLTTSRFAASVAMMIYSGSLPFLMDEWGMSGTEAGAIQSAFNLAYAASLLVASWLSDHISAKRVFLASNALSLVAFALFALVARSYESALILYGIVGLALGGSYTPALMLVAAKFPSSSRGTAMGVVLAGSSLGYCSAIALAASGIPVFGYRPTWAVVTVVLCIGLATSLAALIEEPSHVNRSEPMKHGETSFASTLGSRRSILLTTGYTAHCWELLGMWAWAPAFLTITLAREVEWASATLGIVIACILHFSGALSTLLSGNLSDRLGRRFILVSMATLGAMLSFVFGWSGSWGATAVLILAALYGFATIADSGVLSTAMTESVPQHYLGSMLALRSILGFGAGAISPLAFGWVLDLTNHGDSDPRNWGWAFAMLGAGGTLAALFAIMLPHDAEPTSNS